MSPLTEAVRASRWRQLPLVLVAATVLGHISWILVPEWLRTPVTAASVITCFLAAATHALQQQGWRWLLPYLAITVGLGWLVEAVGTATGFPFGAYEYTDALGPRLLAVPLLIPLAWSMMAYPCLLAVRRLTPSRWRQVLVGGWLFASWDLFLDPQMVGQGYWIWERVEVALPGIPEIPLQNFAGWLAVALLLMALLQLLPVRAADERVPALLLAWVYLSNVMAAAVFFGRPTVAAWGAVAMGLVMLPWARTWRQRVRP